MRVFPLQMSFRRGSRSSLTLLWIHVRFCKYIFKCFHPGMHKSLCSVSFPSFHMVNWIKQSKNSYFWYLLYVLWMVSTMWNENQIFLARFLLTHLQQTEGNNLQSKFNIITHEYQAHTSIFFRTSSKLPTSLKRIKYWA